MMMMTMMDDDDDDDNNNNDDETLDKSMHTTRLKLTKFFNVIGISSNLGSKMSPPISHI